MPDVPAFRSFRGVNTLLLKDGQTRLYTVATDRVTGEVLKVDVALKVLKSGRDRPDNLRPRTAPSPRLVVRRGQ